VTQDSKLSKMASPPPPVSSPLSAIGNTPVVRLNKVVPDNHASVYLKLESLNPTGSYKDRMAKSMIEEAERRGTLKPDMTVVEATGGSTGGSLAFICAVKGYKFKVVSSNAFAAEKLKMMAAFGAEVIIVESDKITPDLFPNMLKLAKEIASEDGHYYTSQFSNADALPGYATLGEELAVQFPGGIDAFCGAAGSAGMIMGVSKVLKSKWPDTRVVVLEPASAPVISEGRTGGSHSVEGVGPGFVPPHLEKELYDEAGGIAEEEGRAMCRQLAREEGLLVGTSTGLNVVAAIALAKELRPGKTVVTVAVDTGLKYMNGNLLADS
jgi:cysteine synthase